MSDVTFNIYGGNNQILPNATKAEQNFYGDQFAEKTLAKDGEAPQPLTGEEQALAIYINKVESLRGYITLLRSCKTARDRKQSLRAVLRTLIKIYTFAPNFKFGTK